METVYKVRRNNVDVDRLDLILSESDTVMELLRKANTARFRFNNTVNPLSREQMRGLIPKLKDLYDFCLYRLARYTENGLTEHAGESIDSLKSRVWTGIEYEFPEHKNKQLLLNKKFRGHGRED